MYKKLQLNKTQAFELAIGTYLLAKMLVDFIKGECQYQSLGKEQGNVDKWDDFVLKELNGHLIHYQIKENNNDFCDKPIARSTITKGQREGQPSDLSEFDKTIQALLVWYKANLAPEVREAKRFILCVPYHAIFIKEGLSLKALMRLCNEQIKPLTDVEGLERLAGADTQIKSLYSWLTEWCGFTSWEEVLGIFSRFQVKAYNSTKEINDDIERDLAHYFTTPGIIRQTIENTLLNDANFTTLVPAKYLLEKVRWDLLPSFNPWSKYRTSHNNLYVSGIQDSGHDQEFPDAIVDGLWDCTKPRSLYFDIPMELKHLPIYQSLLRICLHLPPGNQVFAPHREAVVTHLLEEVGETIGIQHLELERIPVFTKARIDQSAVEREISAAKDFQTEADSLSDAMSQQTWTRVVNKVIASIRGHAMPLQNELDQRWHLLQSSLDHDSDRRQKLFRSMMHPKAERQTILSDLRIGPQTAELLAQAIIYQLIVLTALDAPDEQFEECEGRTIQTLALKMWSGPMNTKRKRVRKLSENVDHLMGQQPCDILVMPHIDAPSNYLCPTHLASNSGADDSLMGGRQISIVVTGTPELQAYIDDGDITAIKRHILANRINNS